METKAVAKYIRISPQKARLVADVIRGMNAEKAVTTLRFMPKKAARIIRKVLESAVANADQSESIDVATLYVKEIFSGLNPKNKPQITLFDNKYQYNEMLIERNITFHSNCEHHFVPIMGKVHVAYIPEKKVIGLSKINRLVQYFAKRPQVQERLTMQIADELCLALETKSVAVIIEADHACVITRGIKDVNSNTITSKFYGKFMNTDIKREFLQLLGKM